MRKENQKNETKGDDKMKETLEETLQTIWEVGWILIGMVGLPVLAVLILAAHAR
jgi:LPS O-antigen subunit length determinant protein (WzzB/FepE family)